MIQTYSLLPRPERDIHLIAVGSTSSKRYHPYPRSKSLGQVMDNMTNKLPTEAMIKEPEHLMEEPLSFLDENRQCGSPILSPITSYSPKACNLAICKDSTPFGPSVVSIPSIFERVLS